MKTATIEGYPYVRPVCRGVMIDVDKSGSEQVEEWLERILYGWGVQAGEEGPRVRITVEVIGGVRAAEGAT